MPDQVVLLLDLKVEKDKKLHDLIEKAYTKKRMDHSRIAGSALYWMHQRLGSALGYTREGIIRSISYDETDGFILEGNAVLLARSIARLQRILHKGNPERSAFKSALQNYIRQNLGIEP